MLFTTDAKRIWVGDGTTAGGVDPFAADPYGDVYNVKLYGATGDGVTDDLAAIQAAIDAAELAGGGLVSVPPAQYALSDFLVIDSPNVSFVGTGAGSRIIAPTAAGDFVLKVSAAGVKVKDLCFVGGCSTVTGGANECISLLSGATNTEITGCLFTGVDAAHGFNVQIRAAAGADGPNIHDNAFERVIGTASGYGYGIQLADVNGGVISGNVSTQTTTQGRHHIYLSAGCTDISVYGNALSGGVKGMINVFSTMLQDQLRGCVIEANTLNGLGKGAGGLGAIHLVTNVADCSVIGNSIYDVDGYGIEFEADGINAVNCYNNAAIGNSITNPDTIGIYVKGAYGAVIECNRISGAGSGTAAAAISLNTTGASIPSRAMISGNVVTGTTHTYAIRSDGVGCVFGDNVFAVGTSGVSTGLVPSAAADDTTPSVYNAKVLLIPANSVATAITQLDDSAPGQQVTLVLTNATNPSTIADSATFILAGNAAWGGSIDDTITLFTVNGGASAVWREISRSAN
jgi:hypothetical protein